MNKLYNYLLKIGVEERPKHGHHDEAPAIFYRETYGDSSYFYNAPNHTHPGAVVALDYNVDAPQEYFKNLRRIEESLERYCTRYHYEYTRRACYGVAFYTIESAADRAAANDYYYFRDAARRECEQYYHIAINNGTPQKEIETTLREIMNKYGANYTEFLQAAQPATA